MKDVVLDEANRNTAIEPARAIDHGHTTAIRDVASGNEKRTAIRLPKRVAQEGHSDVGQSNSGLSLDTMRAYATGLGVAEDQVTEDAKFIDDLGADSLDQVELVMAFEEEFGSDIPDEDAEKLTTVGDAIKYIESKQQA